MCVEVSGEWLSGSQQECSDNSLRDGEIKTHARRPDITESSHTVATSSGLRPVSFATFYHAAENVYHKPQPGCPLLGFFSVGPDHWRGLASCWVGEFAGFFPSWQFRRVQSVLLKQSAYGQSRQRSGTERRRDEDDKLLASCRHHSPDGSKWGKFNWCIPVRHLVTRCDKSGETSDVDLTNDFLIR